MQVPWRQAACRPQQVPQTPPRQVFPQHWASLLQAFPTVGPEQVSGVPVDAAPELEPGGVPLALVADLVVEVEPSEDPPLAKTLVPLVALRVELLTPTVSVPEPD